jgi:hypothetical protein
MTRFWYTLKNLDPYEYMHILLMQVFFLHYPNFGTWLLIHVLFSLEHDFIKLNEVLWLRYWDCNGHVILQAKIMFMKKVKVETIHMRVLSAHMFLYIPFNFH